MALTRIQKAMGPMGKILVTHRAINHKQKNGFEANFGWVLDLERTMFPTSDSKMQNMKKVIFCKKLRGGWKNGGYYQIIDVLNFRDFFGHLIFETGVPAPKLPFFSQKYARLAILGRNRPGRLLGWLVGGCEARASLTIERLRQVLRCCGKLSTICQQKSDAS